MEFEHSLEEYTVSEFYHVYKSSLPKLAIVTQGYFGEIGIETYDRGQVLRIETHSEQQRVIADVLHGHKTASGLEGKQLSIPVDFELRFFVINKNGHKSKKDALLSEILEKHKNMLPVTVEFSDTEDQKLVIGLEERSASTFYRLQLLETYEDLYLLGNPISDGKLYSRVLSVPVYLQDMRLSLVTGVKGYSSETWHKYLDGMAQTVKEKVMFGTTSGNQNIAVYKKESVSDTNYALTSPCEYYNVGDVHKSFRQKQDEPRSQGFVQEPADNTCIYELIDVGHKSAAPDVSPKRPPPLNPRPKNKPDALNTGSDITSEKDSADLKSKETGNKLSLELTLEQQGDKAAGQEAKMSQRSDSKVQKFRLMFEQSNKIQTPQKNPETLPQTASGRKESTRREEDYFVEFLNSKEEYGLKDFYENFQTSLPKVVVVTQGYCGEIGLETYDRGQVLRIHTYSSQKRVVCEVLHGQETTTGLEGKYLTIPVDYPIKFNVVKHGHLPKSKLEDLTLKEIIDTRDLPIKVKFSQAEGGLVVAIDSRTISTKHFSKLELKATYDEIYLLGNPITFGKLYSKVLSVPVYLPDIKLSVVTGVKGQSTGAWQDYLQGMTDSIQKKIKFDQTFGNTNIAIYSELPQNNAEDYTYHLPTEYYNIESVHRARKSSKQLTPNLYEDLNKRAEHAASVCLYEPVTLFKKELNQVLSKQQDNITPPVLQPRPGGKKNVTENITKRNSSPPPIPVRSMEKVLSAEKIEHDAQYANVVTFPSPTHHMEEKQKKVKNQTDDQTRMMEDKTTEEVPRMRDRYDQRDVPPKIDRKSKPLLSFQNTASQPFKFEFECGKEEYSVKEFYKQYQNKLPTIVMVTQGYCGQISLETFARGEIIRVHRYLIQKRVIAEVIGHVTEHSMQGKQLSIPLDIDCKFGVVKYGKAGKDKRLEDIIKKGLPVEVKMSKSDKNKILVVGSGERSTSHFPNLNLIEVYDDLYLLGNPVSDGCLYGKILSVPAHLPDMTVSVVTSIRGQSDKVWGSYLSDLHKTVEEKVDFSACCGNKDIAIYSKDSVTKDTEYSFVSPNIYTNLEQLLHGKPHDTEHAVNLYDEIPADKVKASECLYEPVVMMDKSLEPVTRANKSFVHAALTTRSAEPVTMTTNPRDDRPPSVAMTTNPRGDRPPSVAMTTNPRDDRPPSVAMTTNPRDDRPPLPATSAMQVESGNPFDLSPYSIKAISDVLRKLNLHKYVESFENALIDGVILGDLKEEDLTTDFGFKRFEALKLLKFAETGHIPRKS